jgi:hypothetical protein
MVKVLLVITLKFGRKNREIEWGVSTFCIGIEEIKNMKYKTAECKI